MNKDSTVKIMLDNQTAEVTIRLITITKGVPTIFCSYIYPERYIWTPVISASLVKKSLLEYI